MTEIEKLTNSKKGNQDSNQAKNLADNMVKKVNKLFEIIGTTEHITPQDEEIIFGLEHQFPELVTSNKLKIEFKQNCIWFDMGGGKTLKLSKDYLSLPANWHKAIKIIRGSLAQGTKVESNILNG